MNMETPPAHRQLTGRLVAATHNPGKLREIRELLAPYRLDVVSANGLSLTEPVETGDSFAANAILKAQAAARGSNLPALADDSGLCVAALGDAPCIFSARWAGGSKDFSGAMARIERELLAIDAPPPWRAHFVSALALAWPDDHLEVFEGRVDGTLEFPPTGDQGFGYDPIFRPDGYDRGFGQMSSQEKHGIPADGSLALSHRARAFQKLERACLRASGRSQAP
jgi:XTP/dITP diphosphohydrolase